jgi:hypothetical protein
LTLPYRRIGSLPEAASQEVHRLRYAIEALHDEEALFRRLFSSQRTVDLLNRSARQFFFDIRQVLADSIVLRISRLLDPAKSMGRDNLTCDRLINVLKEESVPPKLVSELEMIRDEMKTLGASIRDQRNRRLGHSDLSAALFPSTLPSVAVNDVTELLRLLIRFINAIHLHLSIWRTPLTRSSRRDRSMLTISWRCWRGAVRYGPEPVARVAPG